MLNLKQFIGKKQLQILRDCCKGEEGEYFILKIKELQNTIATMPTTHETDGQEFEAAAHLHYFNGSSDWYITERDGFEEDQLQAFGFACLNGDFEMAELGYISIKELILYGAELDLHWNVKPISKIMGKIAR